MFRQACGDCILHYSIQSSVVSRKSNILTFFAGRPHDGSDEKHLIIYSRTTRKALWSVAGGWKIRVIQFCRTHCITILPVAFVIWYFINNFKSSVVDRSCFIGWLVKFLDYNHQICFKFDLLWNLLSTNITTSNGGIKWTRCIYDQYLANNNCVFDKC